MIKNAFRLLIILIMPITLHAQDTAAVRNQANILAQAMIKGDYETVINNTYPKAVQMGGGTEKMLKLIYLGVGQLKSAGVTFEAISIGEPGKFYNAGDEIHCLVPENITLKTPKSRILLHSNLLGITNDSGKTWSFLDLNNSNSIRIKQVLPNFNPELKIPQATTEQLQ